MHRDQIDAALAARLVAQQFPEWAELPVVPVEVNGWDNRTFRLGETMTVRLPTAEGYVASVEKEQTWLPRLAPWLPLPIPVPIAAGVPSDEYPWPWSIRGWIDGRPAVRERVADMTVFARDISGFLHALHGITPAEGPPAGLHSFYRGASLEHYDSETREAIAALGDRIDGPAATEVWDAALAARWTGRPVWFHGDIAYGNLLVDDLGRLSAVIDFGTSGVGDPACDLVITWVYFSGESRECFRTSMAADGAMWARARGWALWKALITFGAGRAAPAAETRPVDVIDDVLAEHAARTVSR